MANLNPICNYQLHRTLPKLSGNMQIDLVVGAWKSPREPQAILKVNQAHFRPIATDNFVPIVDERIMDRPHHLNIKKFYERTRSTFFNHPTDPRLNSDWPLIISEHELDNLKYIKYWDDSCWAGCKRMSHKLYGTSHEILVPVWLEQAYGIKFTLEFLVNGVIVRSVPLELSPLYIYGKDGFGAYRYKNSEQYPDFKFHNDFVKYLLDYFDYIGLPGANPNVLNIDLKNNNAVVSGLGVESGNKLVRTDPNISRNLIYRERPLLEANSLLTNTFQDYKMITSQLINFNLCFDIESVLRETQANASSTTNSYAPGREYVVRVKTEVLRKTKDLNPSSIYTNDPDWNTKSNDTTGQYGWIWQTLELRDFYTNHHYVPRNRLTGLDSTTSNDTTYSDSDQPINSLEYKQDYMCTDLIHKNKMNQPICHWVPAIQPDNDMMFNVYDGFASYMTVNGKNVEYSHGFGATIDPSNTVYDAGADNTIWAGVPFKGIGSDIQNLLSAPNSAENSHHFHDASGFINGLKYTYDPTIIESGLDSYTPPSAVYIATATTATDMSITSIWGPSSSPIYSSEFIGIVSDVFSPSGESTLGETNKEYGWEKYADIDNRWKQGTTHRKNMALRNTLNTSALYVCMKRTPVVPEEPRPDDPLYIVFWAPRGKVSISSKGFAARDILPHPLTLGGVIEHLREYVKKYEPIVAGLRKDSNADTADLALFEDLKVASQIMSSILAPDIVFFNKSILAVPDVSCSHHAGEIIYMKDNECTAWVERYSGNIKPAMFPQKTARQNTGELTYKKLYGRNQLWIKQPVLPGAGLPPEIARYISTNVPPKYPSLGYDPVVLGTISGTAKKNVKYGDLMYTEPIPVFEGRDFSYRDISKLPIYQDNADKFNGFEWPEYKWFGTSSVRVLPAKVRMDISCGSEDPKVLDAQVMERMLNELGGVGTHIDPTFIKNNYDIDYHLIKVEPKAYDPSTARREKRIRLSPKYGEFTSTGNYVSEWGMSHFILSVLIRSYRDNGSTTQNVIWREPNGENFKISVGSLGSAKIKIHVPKSYKVSSMEFAPKSENVSNPINIIHDGITYITTPAPEPVMIRFDDTTDDIWLTLTGSNNAVEMVDFYITVVLPQDVESSNLSEEFKRDPRTNQVLYTYKYDVIATLK